MITERDKHINYFDIIGLELHSEDDNNYNCVWKGTDKPMWFRKEGLSEMIEFEKKIAKEAMEREYEFWYGRYKK